jgi:hypothetical protein
MVDSTVEMTAPFEDAVRLECPAAVLSNMPSRSKSSEIGQLT